MAGSVSRTAKTIIRNILLLWFLESVFGFFLLREGPYPMGHLAGTALGSAASVIRIVHLEHSLESIIDRGSGGAAVYYRLQYFIRLLVVVAVLGLSAVFHPDINLLSTGLGLLNMSFATYLYKAFNKGDGTQV